MQGQVMVPYTGISGQNMDMGVSTYEIIGSTQPGVVEDKYGTTVNVSWTFPGGINGVLYGQQGLWGYILVPMGVDSTYILDENIKQWLTKTYKYQDLVAEQPTGVYTMQQIEEEDPSILAQMQSDINLLVQAYVHRILNPTEGTGGLSGGNFEQFKQYFGGCYTVGRVK